jgi:hypothetical protein
MIVNVDGKGRPMALFCREVSSLGRTTLVLVGVDLLRPSGSLNVAKLGEDGIWRVDEGWSIGLVLRDDSLDRFYADPNAPLEFGRPGSFCGHTVLARLTEAQYKGAYKVGLRKGVCSRMRSLDEILDSI